MTFKIFTLILGSLVLLMMVLLRLFQDDVKVFVKKTTWYLFGTALTFAVFGLLGLSFRQPADFSASAMAWLYYGFCLGIGILHTQLMFSILPWANRQLRIREWLFTGAVMMLGNFTFFQSFVFFERAGRALNRTYADDFLWGMILFPTALLVMKVYDLWLAIPRVTIKGWELPLDLRPQEPFPGKSIKIAMMIPLAYRHAETIQVDMLAPTERTLGETFYYVLYRQNVEKNTVKKIEIAEGNSRQRMYQWLFYIKTKTWWWTTKQYLDPERRVRELPIQSGAVIFAERLKHWE